MSRATITAQVVPAAGVLDSALTWTAVASGSGNGITFQNDGSSNKALRVKNAAGSGTARTLTAIVTAVVDGTLTVTNRTYVIPDADQITIKNLNTAVYNDSSNMIAFESSGAGLTAALVM